MKDIDKLINFGIINVNKPKGFTSFQVVNRIRKLFVIKKCGHAGTLDKQVVGVLPVLLGRACKLSNYFMKKDKEYVGKMKLHSEVSDSDLREEMKKLVGKIIQKPPVKSRVKRVERERVVNKFELINCNKEKRTAEFHADVEAGTYIRKLISDLGEKIGGAHMIELKRIRAGIFKIENSFKIEEIEKANDKWKKGDEKKLREILIPAEIIKEIVPEVQVKREVVKQLLNGKPLIKKDLSGKISNSELLSVFCEERFIGVYRKSEEKEILARPQFVLN